MLTDRGRRVVGAVGLAAALAAALAASTRAAAPTPFTLSSASRVGFGVGPTALGPDGTVWLAEPVPGGGFAIAARTAAGAISHPGTVPEPGATISPAAIAAGAGAATFVWETAGGELSSAGTATVAARRCTPTVCGPVQQLASWRWTYANDSFPPMGYPAQPVATAVGSRVVAIFLRNRPDNPQMVWAAAAGAGRFGPVHALADSDQGDPVVIGEHDGGVLAAWLDDRSDVGLRTLDWSQWSPRTGFGAVRRSHTLAGYYDADLVASASGDGAALAWIAGPNETDPGQDAEPVWFARIGAGGLGRPSRVYTYYAFDLSLAVAAGVQALAFSALDQPGNAGGFGPALVERSSGGQPLGSAATLAAPANATSPTIAIDGSGVVFATFAADDRAWVDVAMGTGAFAVPTAIGDTATPPAIVASAGGGVALWQTPDGAVKGSVISP